MYSYIWDKQTRGYLLTTQTGKYVANEIRPVFAPELSMTGLDKYFEYDKREPRPLLWAQKNVYLLNGEKVAQLNNTQYGKPLNIQVFFEDRMKPEPVDVATMVAANADIMDIIVADAKRRTKELYDRSIRRCDAAYIAFSGGKDSVALLDICHRVLPLSVPVIFSDTDMELPDTYKVWAEIKARYPDREFICAKAETSALENWRIFAPPSRTIRWCCSVHKSTPALITLKRKLHKPSIKVMAFVGVRGDESYSRSFYEDTTDGVKNASQINSMPILDWGAHELWLYIFTNDLVVNCAYKKGLTRVGCLMCPESSEKYEWFVDKAYPRELQSYCDVIVETSSKRFKSATDRIDFVGSSNWQARKNGLVLTNGITNPLEESNGLKTTFQSPHFQKDLFYEWIKTLGTVVKECEWQYLKLPNTLDDGIPFVYHVPYTGGGTATFEFRSEDEQAMLLPVFRAFFRKVSSCVACKNCEAECSYGAIMMKGRRFKINAVRCIKCRRCYDAGSNYCWRYKSMFKPSTENNNIMRGIANYENFGLRENDKYQWVSILAELGEKFFPWYEGHPLGKNMVKGSARIWFTQALLIYEGSKKPTPLVELFRMNGGNYSVGWDLIWIALVNNSALVKWYSIATEIDKTYTIEMLAEMLANDNPTLGKSTIDGGLAALKDMLTKSPLGGDGAVTLTAMKGRTVQSITRRAKDVHPLTILYGLYLIATKAKRRSFTVRELLTADVESMFVSPLVAFGISPDTFKKQCEGLRTKYPDYISTTFTHGNDGLEVFPQKHSLEDIIALALEV